MKMHILTEARLEGYGGITKNVIGIYDSEELCDVQAEKLRNKIGNSSILYSIRPMEVNRDFRKV